MNFEWILDSGFPQFIMHFSRVFLGDYEDVYVALIGVFFSAVEPNRYTQPGGPAFLRSVGWFASFFQVSEGFSSFEGRLDYGFI